MNISPKKSLGQNFLVNQGVLNKIVAAAELTKDDTVVEVGPGTGNLTRLLAVHAKKVIAIEKDHRLISTLKEEFSKNKNVQIIEGDVLKPETWSVEHQKKVSRFMFQDSRYKIIGNLPYYITSHFLRTVFETWPTPTLLVLMMQREVAERMLAKAGNMNLLALSVQYFGTAEIITRVSRGSFRPSPNVDSTVIRISPKKRLLTKPQQNFYFSLLRAVFSGKRKQLQNTLSLFLNTSKESIINILFGLKIDPRSRPENLSLEQWLALSIILQDYAPKL